MRKIIVKIIILTLFIWTFSSVNSYAYNVKRGDNLWRISQKYGISLHSLLKYNPQVANPSQIYVGEHINTSRSELVNRIINKAMSLRNVTSYRYGAKERRAPWVADCSSWVEYIYGQFGIWLPRSSHKQANVGIPLTFQQIKRGDLLFFGANNDGRVTHVGIYLGHGKWISNLNPNEDVKILNIWGKWSYHHFLWATRVIPE